MNTPGAEARPKGSKQNKKCYLEQRTSRTSVKVDELEHQKRQTNGSMKQEMNQEKLDIKSWVKPPEHRFYLSQCTLNMIHFLGAFPVTGSWFVSLPSCPCDGVSCQSTKHFTLFCTQY